MTYRGPKPAANPYAYDAHEVLNAIGPTIVRIAPAPGARRLRRPGRRPDRLKFLNLDDAG